MKSTMAAIKGVEAARRAVFLRRMGADLKELRLAAGLSQQAVADVFGWRRDSISKVENGQRPLGLYEYLTLLQFLQAVEPNHAALALARRLIPPTLAGRR